MISSAQGELVIRNALAHTIPLEKYKTCGWRARLEKQERLMRYNKIMAVLLAVLLAGICPAHAEEGSLADFDLEQLTNTRIYASSTMLAHIHSENELMLSYSYMTMSMDGNRDGSKDISDREVVDVMGSYGYMSVPSDMDMDMYMFHMMYAPSNDLTLILMSSYQKKEMNVHPRMGADFTTRSEGWSDTLLAANFVLKRKDTDLGEHEYGMQAGLSLPTGSIKEQDFLPMIGKEAKLPYPMQQGSGTFDPVLAGMYSYMGSHWYTGVRGQIKFRPFGGNSEGYRLGREVSLSGWFNYSLTDRMSLYTQLDVRRLGDMHGRDDDLNFMMSPTADHTIRKQRNVDLSLGVNYLLPVSSLQSALLTLEVLRPVYEHFGGPQLRTQLKTNIGLQVVF